MNSTEITIIVVLSVTLVVSLIGAGIFKRKKKNSAATKAPVKETKKEEKPEQKKDTSFKIVKNGKSARISKKAIKNNSRTGLVERVYEKTYDPDKPDDENMFIEIPLDQKSEELARSFKHFQDDDKKKIVSIGELKRKNQLENDGDEFGEKQSFVKKENDRPNKPNSMKKEISQTENDDLFGFRQFRVRQSETEKPQDKSEDYSDMIEAQAILNRRGIKFKR